MWKRLLATAILAHPSFGVSAASGGADSYPNKSIRLIQPFAAGGAVDYLARIVGAKLSDRFGQPVISDPRPGVGGNLAAEMAARATPDGYTLFVGISSVLSSSPSLYPKLGYDLLKDFSYVARMATGTQVLLAHPSLSATSVTELVALARSKPKAVRYGSAGVASTAHLAMELLQSRTGTELLHVPYKGAAPSLTALGGGEVQILFASVASYMPMIQTKRVTALAVASAKRIGLLPGVPTVAESGVPGFDVTDSYGILAPAKTPASVVKLLNTEILKILQMEDVKTNFLSQGLEASGTTPEEWKAVMEAETARWSRVIKDANIPPI